MIVGLLILAAIVTFVVYCCLVVGAQSDARWQWTEEDDE